MKDNNIAFRTSVNGYNKKDVYKYLDSLNSELIERDRTAREKICELTEINQNLNEKNSALSEALNKAEQENTEQLCTLKNENQKLADEAKANQALINELDRAAVRISLELDSLAEQYNSLCTEYKELAHSLDGIDELRKKAAAYDKISAKIKSHTQNPQQSTQSISGNASKTDLDKMLSDSAAEMLSYIKTTQERFLSAIENAQSETLELKAKIEKIINSSKEKI